MEAKIILPLVILTVLNSRTVTLPMNASLADEYDEITDAAEVIRHSALVNGIELVNESDVQELRDRTNANVSFSLSNTSLADLETDNLTQLLQMRSRERKRQERLLVIQAQILQRLRLSRQPNISSNVFSEEETRRINAIFQRMHNMNNNGHSTNDHRNLHNHLNGPTTSMRPNPFHSTMQRLQSFYPSCSLPNNTDKATWESAGSFRIYYQLPKSRYFVGVDLTVLLGKLRLYKMASGFGDAWEPNLVELQRYNSLDSLTRSEPTGEIVVSIYQYMKPLKYNRKEKKRLIQTRRIEMEYEGWLEFDVLSSLNFWLHHSNRNFGFDVEVEDHLGNKLNPNLFFRNMNCSATEDRPFPNIMEVHPEMISDNESTLFDNETYPTLDLQTADVSTLNAAAFHLFPSTSKSSEKSNGNRRYLKKRHLSQQGQKQEHSTCTVEKAFITFEELGLDSNIIFPDGFEWTFCSGHCSFPRLTVDMDALEPSSQGNSNSIFAKLWQLWIKRLQNEHARKSESHCIPVNKQSLHIIYNDDRDNVRQAVLEDFLPTDCACS